MSEVMSSIGSYEARCRLLLRAYPRSWRAHREQEILSVLMAMHDQHDEQPDAHRPSWGIQLDLVAGGLETRWERVLSPVPALVRDRITMLGLVLGAAVCTLIVVFGEIAWPWRTPQPVILTDGSTPIYAAPLLQTAGPVVYGLWVAALIAVLAGRARLGRWLLAGTATVALLLAVVRVIPHPPVYTLAPLALAAVLSTIGHLPSARTTRGWMAAAYIACTGALAATQLGRGDGSPIWDPVWHFYRGYSPDQGLRALSLGLLALAAAAAIIALIASMTGRRWFLAVVVTALPYIFLTLLAFSGVDRQQMLFTAALLSVVLVVATALVGVGVMWGRRTSQHPSNPRNVSASTDPLDPLV